MGSCLFKSVDPYLAQPKDNGIGKITVPVAQVINDKRLIFDQLFKISFKALFMIP